jgi:prepilin-type N-terminal cleavage/methylation domain-containing protein/prepilin-type processing-associated H-X9-DG protein
MSQRRSGFTFIELIVVIFLIAMLVAWLLPAVNSAREAARRAACLNNLRQIGLALHHYQSIHETFPIGTVDDRGLLASLPVGYHRNWIVGLLPLIEQKPLSASINVAHGVYHAANSTARETRLALLHCPSDFLGPRLTPPPSSYAGCNHDSEVPLRLGTRGLFGYNRAWRFEEITDGTSQTLAVGEKLSTSPDLGWMSGTSDTLRNTGTIAGRTPPPGAGLLTLPDERSAEILFALSPKSRVLVIPGLRHPLLAVGGFSSNHPGGFNALMADGSMRFITSTISPFTFGQLANPRDSDSISPDSY